MPAESTSSSAPTSTTFMVLLISSPSRAGWGSRAPPTARQRSIIREDEGLCTLRLADSRCCGVAGVLLQAGRCPVEAGGPALYGRLPHGVGDLQVHGRVEGRGNELALGGERCEDLGGGDLHLGVDLLRAGEQGAAEDAGVAEDVVHAAAVGGEGGTRREGVLWFYLGIGVRDR